MRKMTRILAVCALAGCANPQFDQMQADAVAKVQAVKMTCANEKDCEIKWARSLKWVSDHSAYKLRIANESIITTEGPIDGDVNSAIEITKLPDATGAGEIDFKSGCGNQFGCVPTHEMLLASFSDFLNGTVSPVFAAPSQ